jgi:hypothetical protein
LQIGDQVYADHSYGRLPAGHVRAGARSDSGAIVLTMGDADPYLLATDALGSGDSAGPPGFYYDAGSKGLDSWGVNTHTRYLVGTGVQTLHKAENSGEITILYAAPYRPVLPPELAPCAGEWNSHANV